MIEEGFERYSFYSVPKNQNHFEQSVYCSVSPAINVDTKAANAPLQLSNSKVD